MNGGTLRRSLRWRILLSASAGLILLLAVMALQGAQIVSSLTSQQVIEWSRTTEHSAKHLQARIERDQALIDQLATELIYTAGASGSTAAGFLPNTQKRLVVFRHGLVWLDPEGEVVTRAPEQQPLAALMPGAPPAALPTVDDDRRLSGLLYTGEGRPVVTYSVQMGQLGTLLAIADLETGLLDGFLPRTARGGHAALIDSQGWVLASTKDALRFTRREHPDWVAGAMREGRLMVTETNGRGKTDDRDMMAFAPIAGTGWGLVLGEPVKEALAASFQLRRRMLLLGLAALALVVGYAWWDTGAITKPLRRLTSLAERIAAGDLSTPVAVRRHDEIGMLARSFEAMRLSLRGSREKLEDALAETRRRERETVALYAVTQEILRTGSGGALRTVVERVRELLGGSAGAICLAESPDSLLRCVATTVALDDSTPGTGGTCVAPHQAPASPLCPLLRRQEHQQVFVEQVSREGAARGYLCLAAGPASSISEQDRTLLAGLANLAGLALVHEQSQAQSRTLAVYAERERISRELHDSVSQSLSYLYSQLELLREILPKLSTEQLRAELSSLSGVASVAFEEARDSIFSLRIAGGGGDPLPILISGCVRDFKARSGIPVELDAGVMASISLTPEAEVQLVHIVQEALSNVARHTRATRVVVRAEVQGGELRVTIQDNGEGFDPQAPRPGRRSFGLEMMCERAESVGGSLQIRSSRDHGTRILVGVPLGGEVLA
ncbi:hypothetical protein SY88_09540 [Clostridiales bacterium PH28_bin88]|nr:hypothetical protein SY88_09540 [Clostridiales bacterium PH28_bin88]